MCLVAYREIMGRVFCWGLHAVSQSSTVHAPPRLLEHPPQIFKPAALGLALSQNRYLVAP